MPACHVTCPLTCQPLICKITLCVLWCRMHGGSLPQQWHCSKLYWCKPIIAVNAVVRCTSGRYCSGNQTKLQSCAIQFDTLLCFFWLNLKSYVINDMVMALSKERRHLRHKWLTLKPSNHYSSYQTLCLLMILCMGQHQPYTVASSTLAWRMFFWLKLCCKKWFAQAVTMFLISIWRVTA